MTKSAWLTNALTAIITGAFAFAGAYLAFYGARLTAQSDYQLKFAQTINQSLPHLRNPGESGIALAALLALAQTEVEKRAVISVGVNANTPQIRETLALFLTTDSDARRIAGELPVRHLILSSVAQNLYSRAQRFDGNWPTVHRIENTPDGSSVDLIRALDPQPQSGWVYLENGAGNPEHISGPPPLLYHLRLPRIIWQSPGMLIGGPIGVLPSGTTLNIARVSSHPLGVEPGQGPMLWGWFSRYDLPWSEFETTQ